MKSIRPVYLILQNVGSFGGKETRIDFPAPGESMLIKGDIGTGKSTIFSALFYCLTGKKMNGAAATLVNSVNGKNAVVESAWVIPGMTEPLVVRRGMKPSLLSVSGVEASTQAEVQAALDRITHITDPHVLLNLCVLSVSRSLPFFSLDKQARLQFLRTFVDTSELDILSEAAKNTHLDAKKSASALTAELGALGRQRQKVEAEIAKCSIATVQDEVFSDEKKAELESILSLGRLLLSRAEGDRELYLGRSKDRVQRDLDMSRFYRNFDAVDAIRTSIEDLGLQQDADRLADIDASLRSMRAKLAAMDQGISDTESNIAKVESPTCRQHFHEMLAAQQASRAAVNADIAVLSATAVSAAALVADKVGRRRSLESELATIVTAVDKAISDMRRRNTELEAQLRHGESIRVRAASADRDNDKRESLQRLLESADADMQARRIDLAVQERTAKVAEEYRAVLDKTWAYMTGRMIPYINSRLPYYMSRLGLDFTMVLDPTDISKPVFKGRPGIGELKLDDLSTGQIRAISFCLAHALRDLESNIHGVDIGFLAVDELASNFNPDMVTAMMDFEFQNMRDSNTSLILITHDIALHNRPEWDHILHVERNLFSSIRVVK